MSDANQLRGAYTRIRKTLRDERLMRMQVFPEGHPKRQAKLAEIDLALEDLKLLGWAIRDVLDNRPEQLKLVNVSEKYA